MKYSILLFFVISNLPLSSYAKEKAEEILIVPGIKRISTRFLEGQFLIYDCDNKRYICVDEDGQDKCQYLRRQRKVGNFENLGCAPLKILKSPEACFKMQKELIFKTKSTPFCDYSSFQ